MDLAFLPPHLAERSHLLRDKPTIHRGNFVLYWTHHALRTDENPALDVARLTAQKLDLPLLVYQGLSPHYRFASDRHHTFMLEGARDLQQQYRQLDISYEFSLQRHSRSDPRLKERTATAAVLVTEDFPLEPTMLWTNRLAECTTTPIILVDTACVLPSRRIGRAFDRAFEYRQATIGQYLDRIPRPWPRTDSQPKRFTGPIEAEFDLASIDLSELVAQCEIDHTVGPVHHTRGGSSAGMERWAVFQKNGLKRYADRRNSAEIDGTSRMSAYLHYGMMSPMRLAREAHALGAEKFLDELLIWRELAYTFCHYRPDVDSLDAIPGWARATLNAHANDPREAVYSWETTALARTGNEFWDACQRSLIKHGELHNNLRMTWGKALLDWTKSPLSARTYHRSESSLRSTVAIRLPTAASSGAWANSIARLSRSNKYRHSPASPHQRTPENDFD
ncbi:MAG: deoxyribodipyrimidine photo-lyase [Pirellulales bacterium]